MEGCKFSEGKFKDGNGNPLKREDLVPGKIIRTRNDELYALKETILPIDCPRCGFGVLEIFYKFFTRKILDLTCPYCGAKWQYCLVCAKIRDNLFKHGHGITIYEDKDLF